MVNYMAWAKRNDGEDCPSRWDVAVRESAAEQGIEINGKYPIEGWMSGNHTGGELGISNERFAGSFPVWIWEG